jgi:hypothetical protein
MSVGKCKQPRHPTDTELQLQLAHFNFTRTTPQSTTPTPGLGLYRSCSCSCTTPPPAAGVVVASFLKPPGCSCSCSSTPQSPHAPLHDQPRQPSIWVCIAVAVVSRRPQLQLQLAFFLKPLGCSCSSTPQAPLHDQRQLPSGSVSGLRYRQSRSPPLVSLESARRVLCE